MDTHACLLSLSRASNPGTLRPDNGGNTMSLEPNPSYGQISHVDTLASNASDPDGLYVALEDSSLENQDLDEEESRYQNRVSRNELTESTMTRSMEAGSVAYDYIVPVPSRST